jgi:alpha-L-rhamnosidase
MPPSPNSNPDQPPINWVRAHYDSIHGRITSGWKSERKRFELEVQIPANTTATVYLPGQDIAGVTEAGKGLAHANGIKFLRKEGDRLVLAIESGAYHFSSRGPL